MTLEDELRQWARGSRPQEAAIELLLRAFAGRYARPEQPWVKRGVGYMSAWVDFEAIPDQIGWLSDRERRVLLLAASLGENVPVVLGDVVAGLDRDSLALVLAAIAHACTDPLPPSIRTKSAGSDWPGNPYLESLYPWPDETPAEG